MKRIKRTHVILFLLIFLLFSSHKTYNFIKIRNIAVDIENSISSRKNDYIKVFQLILEKGEEVCSLLENKNLYLSSNNIINFNNIKYEILDTLKNQMRSILLSEPYYRKEIYNEPIIDISYIDKNIKNQFVKISMTVLFSDFFIHSYYEKDIKILIKEGIIDIETIKNSIFLKTDEFYYKIFLYFIVLFLFLLYSIITENNRKNKDLHKKIESEKKLIYQIETLYQSTKITQSMIMSTDKNKEKLNIIIQNITLSLKNITEEKSISLICLDFNEKYTINGSIIKWYQLLLCVTESIIAKKPPKTNITIRFKKIVSNNIAFDEITFYDNYPIEIKNDINEKINIEKLSNEMNIYIKIGFNEKNGNTLTIAIPHENTQEETFDDSNILLFSR